MAALMNSWSNRLRLTYTHNFGAPSNRCGSGPQWTEHGNKSQVLLGLWIREGDCVGREKKDEIGATRKHESIILSIKVTGGAYLCRHKW